MPAGGEEDPASVAASPECGQPAALPPLARGSSLGSPGSPFLPAFYGSRGSKRPGGAGSGDEAAAGPPLSRSPTQARMAREKQLPKFGDSFGWTASRDLPAEYRSVQEDNKMLSEELRRMKQRAHEAEATAAAQERQLVALREEAARLQQALRQCSVSPSQLLQDKDFKLQLERKDQALRQLEAKAAVLERAKESAERRHKADLAAERKAAEAHKVEAAGLKEALAEKDRQARMTALHLKSLYQRLAAAEAATKGAPPLPQPQQPQAPVPPPSAAPPEEGVRLMLCIVHDRPGPTAAEQAEALRLAALEAAYVELLQQRKHEAAVAIQTRFRAFQARRQVQQQRQAVMKIQAHVRGMLTRRSLVAVVEGGGLEGPEKQHGPLDRLRERRQQAEQRHGQRRRKGFAAVPPTQEEPAGRKAVQRCNSEARPPGKANTAPEAAQRQRQAAAAQQAKRASASGLGGILSPPRAESAQGQSRRPSMAGPGGIVPASPAQAGLQGAGQGAVPKLALSRSFKSRTPTLLSS